jgi:hypothetical protein
VDSVDDKSQSQEAHPQQSPDEYDVTDTKSSQLASSNEASQSSSVSEPRFDEAAVRALVQSMLQEKSCALKQEIQAEEAESRELIKV